MQIQAMQIQAMEIQAWDEVFIRCRRSTVNGLIVDVDSWPQWWPGLTSRPVDQARELVFRPVGVRGILQRRAPQTLQLTTDRVRPRDKGLEFSVSGDVVGTGEWYHLDERDGVVVHYLLHGQLTEGNPRIWLRRHRASVRAALTDLKRRLEFGRAPGAEPHPALLTHQAAELAIFAQEVARHDAELATNAETLSTNAEKAENAAPVSTVRSELPS